MELKIKCVDTATNSDGSQYGKFVIEPLERGFGTTIGNALRRVLLSSLEGTAVTSARIESITHEYTAIPGVLEDVIDVILNLKGLVVKTDSKEAQHLRIDVDKPGPVLASDIQLPAGVKVVNPDWLICTVADGGSFHADVIVESGKGYVPHDVPRDVKGDSCPVYCRGAGKIAISLANCCTPIPGDDIIGYITKGKGISVHRKNCPNVINEKERLIEVFWRDDIEFATYPVDIAIEASDRNNLLVDVMAVFNNAKVGVNNLHARSNAQNLSATISATIMVSDSKRLQDIFVLLKGITGVYRVDRVIH